MPGRGIQQVAEQTIRDADASGHWPGKVMTKVSDAGPFCEAETEPFPRHGVEAASRETAG